MATTLLPVMTTELSQGKNTIAVLAQLLFNELTDCNTTAAEDQLIDQLWRVLQELDEATPPSALAA
jgi:hypothetical protein